MLRFVIDSGKRVRKGGKMVLISVIVFCSDLKRSYREILRGVNHYSDESNFEPAPLKVTAPSPHALSTIFVFLNGPKQLLVERMSNRQGHFMKRAMLESQLDTLGEPMKTGEGGVIEIHNQPSPELQMRDILSCLQPRADSSLHS